MVAVEAPEDEVAEAISGTEEEIALAAVNAPGSVVVSGTEEAVLQIQTSFEEKGARSKRLAVSHAFHSPLIDPMLEGFAEVASSLTFHEPRIPIVSATTGEPLDPVEATSPDHWVRQAREPVRFADAVATLHGQGVLTYLEIGPDAVLTAMAASCLVGWRARRPWCRPCATEGTGPARSSPPWRRPTSRARRSTGPPCIPAPTTSRSPPTPSSASASGWSRSPPPGTPPSLGQEPGGHPFLGAVVELPDEGLLMTGRVSLQTHPWLADHEVAGTPILPGAAFLEMALRAGREVGAGTVEELTLQAPLILPEEGAVAVQVLVDGPGREDGRSISIRSRAEGDAEWVEHAVGRLAAEPVAPAGPPDRWPPEGAEEIGASELYPRLAAAGLEYGPAFRGLRRAWRRGKEVFAEVALAEAERAEAGLYMLHPALLDAALHAGAALAGGEEDELRLPFVWSGVSLTAAGAAEMRVSLTAPAAGEITVVAHGGTGAAIVAGSLRTRALDPAQLHAAAGAGPSLFGLDWAEHPLALVDGEAPTVAVLGDADLGDAVEHHADLVALLGAIEAGVEVPEVIVAALPNDEGDPVDAAHRIAAATLSILQDFLAAGPLQGARLAVLSHTAVAAREGERPGLAAAAAWGLVRSAQSEHPGRFSLLDSDSDPASLDALRAALATAGEPQIVLREGRVLVPRLSGSGGRTCSPRRRGPGGSTSPSGAPLIRSACFPPLLPRKSSARTRCGSRCALPGSTSATS